MNTEPPAINKTWLTQWVADFFYGDLELHEQEDGSKGYFDRREGLSSFRGFGHRWSDVYRHLNEIRQQRDAETE